MGKRFLLIVALLLAIGTCVMATTLLIKDLSEKTLLARSQTNALVWVEHFSQQVGGLESFIEADAVSQENFAKLDAARGFANVFRFQLFDTLGRKVLVSDDAKNAADGLEVDDDALHVVQTRKISSLVKDGRTKDNRPDWYAEIYLPLIEDGQVAGVAEVYVDVTEARTTIVDGFSKLALLLNTVVLLAACLPLGVVAWFWIGLRRSNEQLDAARQAAEAAERAKSRFLANMSHEIRTPMNGVIGMSELLAETELDNNQTTYTQTIRSSASALLSIINDVLDLSKIEANKMQVYEKPFDLHACVQDAASLLSPVAFGKGLEMCVDFRENLPAWVNGDEPRVRQCLLNVLGNAIKFTERGNIELSVHRDARGLVRIEVRDSGCGIPEDKLASVFNSFEQVENDETRSAEGTGLGLAITQRLARLMGGEVELASVQGEGSVFTLVLPLPKGKPPKNTLQIDLTSLSGQHALVVGDCETSRRILEDRLKSFGMTSEVMASATEALSTLLSPAGPSKFDVAILDCNAPGKACERLVEAMAADTGLRELPVLILSASNPQILQGQFKGDNIRGVLSKPVRADLLALELGRAFGVTPENANITQANAKDTASLDAGLMKMHVAVAEDNRTNQFLVKKMVGPMVGKLTLWQNGREAVDNFEDARPDIILMDMSMPVVDGLEATRRIRANENEKGVQPVPIIALTANAMEDDRQRCLDAGMNGFLSKPVRKADLLNALSLISL